jgi:hypothetical protein
VRGSGFGGCGFCNIAFPVYHISVARIVNNGIAFALVEFSFFAVGGMDDHVSVFIPG